jgi:3-dehydroquinate dehydratase/shikimate dehydrogenase
LTGRAGICLCLAEETLEADLRHVTALRKRIDLVELRVDHLKAQERASAGRLPRLAGVPAILTVRRTRDGGLFNGDERERLALLDRLVDAGFAYVDIEEDLQAPGLEARIAGAGARIIRSLHDFSGVPHDLSSRLAGLARNRNEIPKAAVMPNTCAELARILHLFKAHQGKEKVFLGMGDIGFPTRVLAARLGSAWCYSSPTAECIAPGQIDPIALEEEYRYRSIGPDTGIYGVIGNPIMHSRSPGIHNRGFAALGRDAVYLPFLVPDLEGFWAVADALEIKGLSVTVPHKQAVLAGVRDRDALVEATGACNTITRKRVGAWQGTNTDIQGFLIPLRAAYTGSIPSSLAATVIGAGGAARSIVYALASIGAQVLVLNRTLEHARAIAADFRVEYAGLDAAGLQRARRHADLIVQTTSVGMAPNTSADPAPELRFSGREIVYELIYAPQATVFVKRALQAGCRVIYGRHMLLEQAKRQFFLFTGAEYPSDLSEFLADDPD